jgi:putative NIF3 family GTP cyclohydrolase 1 type 2
MRLSRFYNLVIKFGSDKDPRKLKPKNFPDTAILYGNPSQEIKKILVGIDIETADLLLADRIRQRQGLDLVLSHHPEGRAYASLYQVIQLQLDLLTNLGIPKNIAQAYLNQRKDEVERKVLPQNHMRSVDAARLLNMPFMCAHTPADNHVQSFIKNLFLKERPKKVKDILDLLNQIPEYKQAKENSVGPRIILGSPNRTVGRISIEMTGGTEGPKDIFDKLYKKGVRTLVCMHLSEEHFKKVKDANLNVVIAGHISSDALGLNLLLDRIEKEEKLSIIGCSGFQRVRHS